MPPLTTRSRATCFGGAGVFDAEVPAGVVARHAADGEIAAEVDEHAGGAGSDEFVGDEVGGEALADAAEVDRRGGRGGDGGSGGIHHHHPRHAHDAPGHDGGGHR